MRQTRFLDVVPLEEARRRFTAALPETALASEDVALDAALGRILAGDVASPGDVPAFDRADLDGFAVRAADTFGADDEHPVRLRVVGRELVPGDAPETTVEARTAVALSTGAVIPRGADAVVAVEQTDLEGPDVRIRRAVVPGAAITAAGSDVVGGETLLFAGTRLTSRETGTLAAAGVDRVRCVRRPVVAVVSTGGELVAPGAPLRSGLLHDANGTTLSDAAREAGADVLDVERVPDDATALRAALERALGRADAVIVSGGTSKGGGDLVPEVVHALGPPGLVVHGVDLKPGKPLGLAVCRGKPVFLLPGFPTSALFTFHEVAAPWIRRRAGLRGDRRGIVRARLPRRLVTERGRTEYLLVALVDAPPARPGGAPRVAYPMGKGSGSLTAFSRADGFVRIGAELERIDEGTEVDVTLIDPSIEPADLVVIGSQCVGLDVVLSRVAAQGHSVKSLQVGSTLGLEAARRGECDVAPVHLLDEATTTYNAPFLTDELVLVAGYRRRQVLAFRPGDARFVGRSLEGAVATALSDPACRIVMRQRGSGTRVWIDRLLRDARPPGFDSSVRSHAAVAAAIAQRRADFGVLVEGVAARAGLASIFVADEHFDFAIPRARLARAGVVAFLAALDSAPVRADLASLGFARP